MPGGQRPASKRPGPAVVPILLLSILVGMVSPALARGGSDQAPADGTTESARAAHGYIEVRWPDSSANWTAGSEVWVSWEWRHDPDPVHEMAIYLSYVGCGIDTDQMVAVLEHHKSSSSNGNIERHNWTLDSGAPTTPLACVVVWYSSPSWAGMDNSEIFAIWNSQEPVTQLWIDMPLPGPEIPSGATWPLTLVSGIRGMPLVWTNFSLSASEGNLSGGRCTTDVTGTCRIDYAAPVVANSTQVAFAAAATHSGFADSSLTRQLSVVPPGAAGLLVSLISRPDTVVGGTPVTLEVRVQNATHAMGGASVHVSAVEGTIEVPTGVTDAEGIFITSWLPPATLAARCVLLTAAVEHLGYSPAYRNATVCVVPRSPAKLFAAVWIDDYGVVSGSSTTLHVQVTNESGYVAGARVEFYDSGGAKLEPSSEGNTDTNGIFAAKLTPPSLTEPIASSLVLKLQVSRTGHSPAETQFIYDVYPEPPVNTPTEVAYVSTGVGLAVVDFARSRLLSMLPTGQGGHDLVFDAGREVLFISNSLDSTVSAVNITDLRVVATIPVGMTPRHLSLSCDGGTLWSLNEGDPSLSAIDATTLVERARIVLDAPAGHGELLRACAVEGGYGPGPHVLMSGGRLFLIQDGKIAKAIDSLPGAGSALELGERVAVGSRTGQWVGVHFDQFAGTGFEQIASNVTTLAPSSSNEEFFAGLSDTGQVGRFRKHSSAEQWQMTQVFPGVPDPAGSAFSAKDRLLFVASGSQPEIAAIQAETGTVVDRLSVGSASTRLLHNRKIALSPGGDDLLATDSGDGRIVWAFIPHLKFHAVHGFVVVGVQPVDIAFGPAPVSLHPSPPLPLPPTPPPPAWPPALTFGNIILAAAGGMLLTVATLGAAGALGSEIAVRMLLFLPLVVYARLRKAKPLDQFKRGEIYGAIKANPGIRYRQVMRLVGVGNGTLSYHLHVLTKEGLIRSMSHLGAIRFYPAEMENPERLVELTTLQHRILMTVIKSPGVSLGGLARGLGLSHQTAGHNLRRLESLELVRTERRAGRTRCYQGDELGVRIAVRSAQGPSDPVGSSQ